MLYNYRSVYGATKKMRNLANLVPREIQESDKLTANLSETRKAKSTPCCTLLIFWVFLKLG